MDSQSTQTQLPAARPTSTSHPPDAPEEDRRPPPRSGLSLLWRVFLGNAVVFVVAFAIVAWTPVTVHRIATPSELLVLAILLIVMLAFDLLLLRRAFRPLRRLAATMGAVDPTRPGRRADPFEHAGAEVLALARALNAMLDRLEGERRESGRRVLAAQERERSRIARELHDEVGQTLTAIAIRAERAAGDPGSQRETLVDIGETALRSLEDVRRIGRELRPEALDDLGLVNALIALCGRVDRQGGLRVRRELDWHLPELSPEVELVIYRTAQEALTNVLRHAGATQVFVALKRDDGRVVLRVSDNGRGLPLGATGRGLRGLRERAMVIDAQLEIGPGARRGTEITLTVPTS
ncbi:MAG: HAMP domain-containing protein [Solirubrobacterales bacterium]|nr:HAMP domain-containing protein [Solirubrobacterales bacterium]MBV9715008.1 HAMP domain-containing protein [Solirubrobacterales bacterium]